MMMMIIYSQLVTTGSARGSASGRKRSVEIRASKSRPDQGIIKVRATTPNQNNEPVQVSLGNLIVRGRPASSGETHG
jgi:hypothetical protein